MTCVLFFSILILINVVWEVFMHCTRKVSEDLIWVGGNDRRLAMFEGVYSVPDGVSYNSYLLLDEMTVLFDTVDRAVDKVFFENVEYALGGRSLDYVVCPDRADRDFIGKRRNGK